jgi:hypothetical protein
MVWFNESTYFFNGALIRRKKGLRLEGRVARWYIFRPKCQFFVYFGRSRAGEFGVLLGHLVFLLLFRYILLLSGMFDAFLLVFLTKKVWLMPFC